MKRILIFMLVMVLMLASVSPALAGNGGNGGGGGGGGNGGQGGNGNANGQQSQNTVRNQNQHTDRKATFTVLTGVVTLITATAEEGSITVLVYGGQDTSLHGTEVAVPIDASTRFVLKDFGPITFADVAVGDPVSVAIGSDGIAIRVTVGAEIACLPE